MAKRRQKEKGPWDRFTLWMRSNQKILWVVLLILVCFSFGFVGPVQDFFMASGSAQRLETIYGETISQMDWKIVLDRLRVLQPVLEGAWFATFEPLPGALGEAAIMIREIGSSPLDYFAFLENAERLGLRVSDRQLGDAIRVLWMRNAALIYAQDQLRLEPPPKDQNEQRNRSMRSRSLAQEKAKELRSSPFDGKTWRRIVTLGGSSKVALRDVESTLRDLLLIAKLRLYIRASVQVSPQEVFEEFNKDRQKRKLSWVSANLSEELKEKVAGNLTEEQLRLHFDSEQQSFSLEAAIRASWLLLPEEHFKTVAEQKITDADLNSYYTQYRNDYRRPAVSSAEAAFYPLSAEESAALEKELFRDFEEVREEVREKVLEQKTRTEISRFAGTLRQRLFPPQSADATPVTPPTFAQLVEEHDFLVTGSTDDYVSEEDAEEAFGDGYGTQVTNWFTSAARAQGTPQVKAPERAVMAEKGMVFYADVQYRRPRPATFPEVKDEVREAVITEEALALLESTLKTLSDELNEGKKKFEDVPSQSVDVKVGEEDIVKVTLGSEETALAYVGKYDSVLIEKPEEESTGDDEPDAEADDEDAPREEAHEASEAIRTAGFAVEEAGLTGVGVDSPTEAAYLVKVEDVILPDPKSFENDKTWLESRLLRDKQRDHYVNWRSRIRREARGGPVLEEPELVEGEEPGEEA